jgi:hypothetical protein
VREQQLLNSASCLATLPSYLAPLTQATPKLRRNYCLTSPTRASDGTVTFGFTSVPNADFSVLTSTNVALPLGQWSILGPALPYAPGQYQFTDLAATNYPQRFYRVVSP